MTSPSDRLRARISEKIAPGEDVDRPAAVTVATAGGPSAGQVQVLVGSPSRHHQLFGVPHRQHAQQNGIEQAEDGGVGADAYRQREHRDGREHRRLPQHARAVTDIARQVVQHVEAANVAALFPNLLHAAKSDAGRPARLGIAHSRRPVLARLHFEVQVQLFVEFGLGAAAAHEGAKPQQKIVPAHITPSPAPCRWRPPSAPRFRSPLPIACAPPGSAGKTGRAAPVRRYPIRP